MDYLGKPQRRNGWVVKLSVEHVITQLHATVAFREERVEVWTEKKAEVMERIRGSGIEIKESVAAELANYTSDRGPQVLIDPLMQRDLMECHEKIAHHRSQLEEARDWLDFLSSAQEEELELTVDDYRYFFGKRA